MQSVTILSSLILGFIAGSSSCLAVSGGLLLSIIGHSNERFGGMSKATRMKFTWMFIFGRVVSYTILGGLIGLIGSTFTFSPTITGIITLLAAAYMIIAGLEMLQLAPNWLKCAIPRPPKWLANKILDADGNPNPLAPFLLGAATFFLPCGFTQSLQIYTLTTASFWTGATILGAFAIGTVPALLALGFASGALSGKTGKFVLKLAGVFILYLAIGSVQNGLTLLGRPISFAAVSDQAGYRIVSEQGNTTATTTAPLDENGVQVLQLSLIDTSPFYAPAKPAVVAGRPVRLEISGPGGGCRSVFQISGLGVQLPLNKTKNVVEFTPKKPGQYTFSCSMGMYRGTLTVL
jgi:sulfite exporter TauE/SafE